MAKYAAAVDQGTTSTRFMIFDHSGQGGGVDQKEHEQIYPKPGWVEHDPMEIWAAHPGSHPGRAQEEAISIPRISLPLASPTSARPPWCGTRPPASRSTTPSSGRTPAPTSHLCNELAKDGGQDRFREKVGLPLATYFSGPKIKWILDNVEGARKSAEKGELLFGNIDTWVIWNLTGGPNGGVHVTDVTNASRTMLMNLETLDWDEEILGIMGIPRAMLPESNPPASLRQCQRRSWRASPSAGDLGDQQAALFGQTCFSAGEAKNTYGTGCFMLLNTGTKPVQSKNGLLTTLGYKIGDQPAVYALEGSIAITGALVQWLRDNLGLIEKSADVEELARTVEDNGGIYFVPAFSGLFAPYWKSDARGAIVGMTRYVNKGHIARAALEATAFQTREVLDAMNAGLRRGPDRPQGGRRHGLQRDCSCSSRPTSWACPSSARPLPRPPPWAPPTQPAWLLASGPTSKTCAPTGARTRNGSPRWTKKIGSRPTRSGRRPSPAPSTGWRQHLVGFFPGLSGKSHFQTQASGMKATLGSEATQLDCWEQLWAPYDESTYQAVLAAIGPEDILLEIGAGDLRLAIRAAAISSPGLRYRNPGLDPGQSCC
jgi:glycerol kinase